MLASSTVEGGAGANRLRLALSRAGTNDEEAIGALRAHLTVAIAELVAGAQAGDAID